MMQGPLPTAFAFAVMAGGWYYLFYSRAADNLAAVEAGPANRRRVNLRRAGGLTMLLLGVCLLVGGTVDPIQSAAMYVASWAAVMLLLVVIVCLALLDLRLTWKLRRDRRREDEP